jgi:hypothetical protein
VSDTPTTPPPLPSTSQTSNAPVQIGFLTIILEPAGLVGGYLLTNHWGRPLEFRHSTAVQASRVHEILYGPTLAEYLHADLIGKTLIEKSSSRPNLIVTDSLAALALGTRVNLPILTVLRQELTLAPELQRFQHPRCRAALAASSVQSVSELLPILDRLDPSIDLLEPFTRLQDALNEARKLGANQRAA